MRVLLDTQVWLWWVIDHPALGPTARRHVGTGRPVLSPVSLWEVAIKAALGKLDADVAEIAAAADRQGLERLALADAHFVALAGLPHHHRDPFDRMLVAQAQVEGLPLLSADAQLEPYDCELLPARA